MKSVDQTVEFIVCAPLSVQRKTNRAGNCCAIDFLIHLS